MLTINKNNKMLVKRNKFKSTEQKNKKPEASKSSSERSSDNSDTQRKEQDRSNAIDTQRKEQDRSNASNASDTQHKEQDPSNASNTQRIDIVEEGNDREQSNNEQSEERRVNLIPKNNKEQQKNLSDILNLYYDTINQLERELSHLKRDRKNMKITYIDKYLNSKTKLTTEDNIKRQELKKKLLKNGDEIVSLKTKLEKIRNDIVDNLGNVNL